MRQRSFELIRKPDLIGSSFPFNNVLLRYVASCPETGISFYVNNGQGGVVGVRVYPGGRKVLENAAATTSENSKISYDAKRKQRYLNFVHAFGCANNILASHAVFIAWRNCEIPAGMTIDHINGVTTDNSIANLRCVSNEINVRDGGFLTKLRNKGINPAVIQRHYLLRYYHRMAQLKRNLSRWHYDSKLTKDVLRAILYLPEEQFQVDRFIQSLKNNS